MKNSKTTLTPEQITRLYRMGLTDHSGSPETLGIEVLASVVSGCLYSDITARDGFEEHAVSFYASLLPLIMGEGAPLEYLKLIEMEYAAIAEPFPKPMRLLAEDPECLRCFLIAFLENWSLYLREDDLLEGDGK